MVLPVLTTKRETTYRSNGQKRIPRMNQSSTTTTNVPPVLYLIHSFPALACNYTIQYYTAAKQTSLIGVRSCVCYYCCCGNGNPVVSHVLTTKRETTDQANERKKNPKNQTEPTTTTTGFNVLYLVNSFPALACNYTLKYYTGAKQTSRLGVRP